VRAPENFWRKSRVVDGRIVERRVVGEVSIRNYASALHLVQGVIIVPTAAVRAVRGAEMRVGFRKMRTEHAHLDTNHGA
jgi:hypothetical protein